MHPSAKRYASETPRWLFTITVPSLVIRLASPAPLSGPLSIVDGPSTLLFYPGILSDIEGITHSMIGGAPSVTFDATLPRHVTASPINIDWAAGEIEVSQWFEGDAWSKRRVMLKAPITQSEVGATGEPITLSAEVTLEDRGRILDPAHIVGADTWPDTEDAPHAEGVALGLTKRAYASAGRWYGEIVGYPAWAVCPVVQDVVDANDAGTDITWARGLVCSGALANMTSDRVVRVAISDGRRPLQTTGTAADILISGTDADGAPVTLVNHLGAIEITSGTTPDAMLMAPPSAYYDDAGTNYYTYIIPNNTTEAEWLVERPEYPGIASNTLRPGDQVAMDIDYQVDDSHWYRVTETTEINYTGDDGSTETSTSVGGFRLHDSFYSASAALTDSAWVVPNLAEGAAIYLACDVYGGRPSPTDSGAVLSRANEVIHTYLRRSKGFPIDLRGILALREIEGFRIDGQILDGSISPLDWVTSDLLPLLPVAPVVTGLGLTLAHVDPTATGYVADLTLGRDGADGDRIGRRPTQNAGAVVNDVTLRYGWQIDRGTFGRTLYTLRAEDDPATQRDSRVRNDRARRSQTRWGRRSVTIETQWTSDPATAKKIVNGILDRYHMPRWRIRYSLRPKWGGLEANDVLRFTDSEMGITAALARVVEIEHSRQGPTVILEQMG